MKIIKYKNRKLYSVTESKYITLNELCEYIKKGKTLEIYDHDTKCNITNKTLRSLLSRTEQITLTNSDIYNIIQKYKD